MAVIKGLFSLLVLFSLVVSILFVDFVYKTFSFRQRTVKTDAIVVLAGGRGRIEEGVRLYRQQLNVSLYLIGVDPSVRKADLFHEQAGSRPGNQVYLEQVSRNTLENALYARDLLIKGNVRSIQLITSRYHMKRSLLLFRHILPRDIAIYPQPVISPNRQEEWWNNGGSVRLLFSEFYKYCLFRLFFLLSPGELKGPVSLGQ